MIIPYRAYRLPTVPGTTYLLASHKASVRRTFAWHSPPEMGTDMRVKGSTDTSITMDALLFCDRSFSTPHIHAVRDDQLRSV